MRNRELAFRIAIACFILMGGGAFFAGFSPAVADVSQATVRQLRESGEILPFARISEAARGIKPGEVLEGELEREGRGYVYEVEILDAQGQVWEVKLDARTGDLIEVERED